MVFFCGSLCVPWCRRLDQLYADNLKCSAERPCVLFESFSLMSGIWEGILISLLELVLELFPKDFVKILLVVLQLVLTFRFSSEAGAGSW